LTQKLVLSITSLSTTENAENPITLPQQEPLQNHSQYLTWCYTTNTSIPPFLLTNRNTCNPLTSNFVDHAYTSENYYKYPLICAETIIKHNTNSKSKGKGFSCVKVPNRALGFVGLLGGIL
jgi:hypothetical protein